MKSCPARQIAFKGAVLTVELAPCHHSDGTPIVSMFWSPRAPRRLTVDEAEGLHMTIVRIKRELLSLASTT